MVREGAPAQQCSISGTARVIAMQRASVATACEASSRAGLARAGRQVRPLHPTVFPATRTIPMRALKLIAFAATAFVCVSAFAAAPVLKVSKQVTIDASTDKVWEAVKNFDGLNTWHPAVAKDEIVTGKNNVPGAERMLTLKDGGTIKEKLLGFDAKGHSFKYAIIEGVLPVSSYTSTLQVKAAGKGKSTVTWSGSFKRKNTGPNPAANENDETATNTIGGVYQSGLDNLKKMVEGK
jgi:Polyketide cyclase / dehydrase and lipid transport